MKFNLTPGLRKKLALFSPQEIMFFWYRSYKVIFSLFFLVILALAGYQWYYSLHRYQWTEEQKKEYIESTFKETRFRGEKFRALVLRLKQRSEEHAENISLKRDIFTGEDLAK